MRIVGPREVAAAKLGAERLHPVAAAVVEHPDAKVRIVHAERADDRALQDLFVFVVRADEHVDRGRLIQRREPSGVRVRLGRSISRAGEEHQRERGGRDPNEFGDEKDERERKFEVERGAGSVSVIRHHAYWVIMAKLPATMKARPVATGFGQSAAQTKKTPSVTKAGAMAARTNSSTNASTGSAFGDRAFEMRTGFAASRARGFRVTLFPNVTVPVRPIEHPAAPMPSMAIVT